MNNLKHIEHFLGGTLTSQNVNHKRQHNFFTCRILLHKSFNHMLKTIEKPLDLWFKTLF